MGVLSISACEEVYFKPRAELSINSNDIGALVIETHHKKNKNMLLNVISRPSNSDMSVFEFLNSMFQYNMITTINKLTRVTRNSQRYRSHYYKH